MILPLFCTYLINKILKIRKSQRTQKENSNFNPSRYFKPIKVIYFLNYKKSIWNVSLHFSKRKCLLLKNQVSNFSFTSSMKSGNRCLLSHHMFYLIRMSNAKNKPKPLFPISFTIYSLHTVTSLKFWTSCAFCHNSFSKSDTKLNLSAQNFGAESRL